MSETCETIKVKSASAEQGDFVLINKSDFDPSVHKLLGDEEPAGKPSDGLKVDEIKAALEAKGIEIPEGVTLKVDLAALLDAA